jgi:predicted Zn-dependent protease
LTSRHAVLEHEMKHVTATHDVLRIYAQQLEAALNQAKIPTRSAPVVIAKSREAFDAEYVRVETLIKHVHDMGYKRKLQQIYNEIGKRHRQLDTQANYDKVRLSCPADSWPF